MFAGLLLMVLVAVDPEPSPQPSPLKEIIRVQSSPLCTALRDHIAPSVAALLQNDEWIVRGTRELAAMDRDAGSGYKQMDELHLELDVTRIVRNLDAAYALIEVATPAVAEAEGADRDAIENLKNRLRAVADSQRDELNVLDGVLESEQMRELMDASDPLGGTLAPGIASNQRLPSAAAPSKDSEDTLGGLSGAFGGLTDQAVAGIRSTHRVERNFTATLVPLAARCTPKN
jgi:hypothetical protein